MAPTWDPDQYLAFRNHRLRPALELLAAIPLEAPLRIVDLGCGAGNVTDHLRRRWPGAEITGVDSSAEMLAVARKELPGMLWEQGDFGSWRPAQPVDLLYSNAALHWEGDHRALFPRLLESITPGGVLAVQMPRNFGAPSHTLASQVAADGPWAEALRRVHPKTPVAEPGFYFDLLAPLVKDLDIWETEYLQVLTGENPVAEFTKGSWVKALLDALEEPLRCEYEAEYRRRVAEAYPKREDGRTLFPFRRLFIQATL